MNTIPDRWTASGYLCGLAGTRRLSGPLKGRLSGLNAKGLSKAARAAVAEDMSSLLEEILGVDLLSVLTAAWRTHHLLVAAAQRTAAKPSAEEIVDLGTHRITSVHKPTIEVMIDGIQVATIHFELDLTFDVTGAVATVRAGALVNIRSSRLDLTAVLDCEGVELARKRETLQLPGTLHLGDGYRLAHLSAPTRFGSVTTHTSPRPIRRAET